MKMAYITSIVFKRAGILIAALFFLVSCSKNNSTEWPIYGGGSEANRFSVLDQINKSDVKDLQVAWIYRTGDNETNSSEIQCNPIIVNGTMYVTSPKLKLIALDAGTGKEQWKFDPFENKEPSIHANRGVVYWESGDDKRILYTAGSHLFAINALTGKPVEQFGEHGAIDLHEGLDADVKDLYVIATTPGIVYHDLLILGSRVSEGSDAAPGHIRAFDIRTGKRQWIFHTIPHAGEPGADTWPAEALGKVGGANAWAGFSLDEKRGLLFVPTGSPSYDFYGANRKGQNLYGNCVLALKAETGEYVWHYQTVHHDIWDRDLPCQPVLLTVNHDGKKIDAVAQATKSGFIFLLDRETGKPLFPVEEKPFQPSDLVGEETWPTQPIPTKPEPFARQIFREEDVTNISDSSHNAALKRLREVRSAGQFVPPSMQGTVIFPGFDGGAEWGGIASDADHGIVFVNANEMPWILTMVETGTGEVKSEGLQAYTLNCVACHGVDRMGDQHNFPSLIGVEKRLANKEINAIVENGRGRMPSFAHLSKEKREAIVAYITGVAKSSGEVKKIVNSEKPATPYIHTGYHRFLDADGYPAIKPPWGTLSAIDLNTGEYLWKTTLGEFEALSKKEIPPTGTENYGGPILTKGGLIFIGATQDKKIRAFDRDNGKVLWEATLPAGGYATPSTYAVKGKQYVVIAAGGVKMKSTPGDYYVAFALPE